ncbi:hypothetical protein H9P43_001939 [Blastocladiella emersonii ATCC 22665]|nr:hypothetical protein H9P43_001939 [Blastocladiella emersonii ATCC 22665]
MPAAPTSTVSAAAAAATKATMTATSTSSAIAKATATASAAASGSLLEEAATAATASKALVFSRIAGLLTVFPSVMLTINNINCILCNFRGRTIQKAILASAALSLVVDAMILFAMTSWILDPAWPAWSMVTVALNVLKRVHSFVSVHLVFLRFTAIVPTAQRWKAHAKWFTLVYMVFSTLTMGLHIFSYATNGWSSERAWHTPTYMAYRVANVCCVLQYASLAIYTDVSFMLMTRANPHLSRRFETIKQFYNINVYVALECVMLAVVLVPLFLGITNPEVASAPYNEQFLLALITLNASYSVKATVIVPGDTTGSSSNPKPSHATSFVGGQSQVGHSHPGLPGSHGTGASTLVTSSINEKASVGAVIPLAEMMSPPPRTRTPNGPAVYSPPQYGQQSSPSQYRASPQPPQTRGVNF